MGYIGQQFGHYLLKKLLGQGGFADVYLGEHIHLTTQAAIKVLHTPLTEKDVERFRQEARLLAGLDHPHIIRVFDFGIEQRLPFLVMSYAANGTVRHHHPRGTQLPVETVVAYTKQLAAALQYAHYRRIIHRDIKPENMLVGSRGELLLSDFGIATMLRHTQTLTAPSEEAGTIHYMAPEQLMRKPCRESDQYALGVVVYEWLCGQRPFPGNSTMEIALQHLSTPPPALHTHVPSIAPAVEAVVLQALAKQAKDRFASVQAFARALTEAAENTPSDASLHPTVHLQPPAPSPQRVRHDAPTVIQTAPVPLMLEQARWLHQQERLEEAAQLYRHLLYQESTQPLIWQEYGSIEGRCARHKAALIAYECALQLDPTLALSWNGKGAALAALQRPQEALNAFEQALRLGPINAFAWYGKGAALAELGKPDLASHALDIALHFDPQLIEAWMCKSAILCQQARYGEALEALNMVIRAHPHHLAAWKHRAEVFAIQAYFDEALHAYEQVLALAPQDAAAWWGRGTIYWMQHRLEEALDSYNQSLSCDAHFMPAWYSRGTALAALGYVEEALDAFEAAIYLEPTSIKAWYEKARLLSELRWDEEALAAYDSLIQLQPTMPRAWLDKGNMLFRMGRAMEALATYDQVLCFEPSSVAAWHNKSLLFLQLSSGEEALAAIEEALRLAPEDPDNWEVKAHVLQLLQQDTEAELALNLADQLRNRA